MSLEFPSGPVPLNSPFYVTRPPVEELVYQEIAQPGSLIRIKASRLMGKSSLLMRILAYAERSGYHAVSLDFQDADAAVFASCDRFLRWFCINLSRQLQLEPRLDDYWDEEIGVKVSCTIYLQGYILTQINRPLVLALNELNRVFEHPNIAQDFLPLLRSWHEQAKQEKIFQNLRLVVVHSTEVYVPLNLNQSPFNVGLPIQLPPLRPRQVQELARRHGLNWPESDRTYQLMAMVGGHPYLIRLALYHLIHPPLASLSGGMKWRGLAQLLQEAPTQAGIYRNHLHHYWTTLQTYPDLAAAFEQVVNSSEGVELDVSLTYKLESMGLIQLKGDRATPSCQLYRRYFRTQFQRRGSLLDRLKRLEQQNRSLQHLSYVDGLTRLPNRRSFDQQLQQEWQRLSPQGSPLSLILCSIDFFKIYNEMAGRGAGDRCLQQVARAIRQSIPYSSALVARYGGEEFVVLLPQTDGADGIGVAEEIRKAVKALAIERGSETGSQLNIITIAVGVASQIPHPECHPKALIQAASKALYQSKKLGGDRVTLSLTSVWQQMLEEFKSS